MIPKGKLLIIGGAEDKGGESTPDVKDKNPEFEHYEILRELLREKTEARLEVITTGTQHPEETKKEYTKVFRKLGYSNIGFIHIEDKVQARSPEYVERIHACNTVLISGGDQFRLSTILGGSDMIRVMRDKYFHDPGFIVAGTSAGAMVLSRIMITEGGTEEVLIDSDLKVASGFGLLESSIIDTHFIKRGRFSRLAHAIMINPEQLGIGLGEDTALVIRNGREAECRGSGMVVVIDGSEMGTTNITEASEGSPVFVERLIVHLLVRGCRFSLEEREMKGVNTKLRHDGVQ